MGFNTKADQAVLDQKALVDIYDQHSQAIFRYAFRLLGDRNMAEDCVAETFSRFLQALQKSSNPVDNVKSYLYRVAHNWVIDQYRREPVAPQDIEEIKSNSRDHDPVRMLDHRLTQENVRQALMQLSSDQQQVIVLRFFEELSHEEVAGVLGKSVDATRALQYRAVLSLRELLGSMELGVSEHAESR